MGDRMQREIEEILNKLDLTPRDGRWRRLRRRLSRLGGGLRRGVAIPLPRLSVSHIMLVGIGLLLFGYFFRFLADDLSRWVIIGGLGLFFVSFILSFRRPRSEMRWRGRVLHYHEPGTGRRLREWLDRWRHKRSRR